MSFRVPLLHRDALTFTLPPPYEHSPPVEESAGISSDRSKTKYVMVGTELKPVTSMPCLNA
jgi:hypothetical protein